MEAITIRPIAIETEDRKFIHVDKYNRVYKPDDGPFTNELMIIIGEDSDSE